MTVKELIEELELCDPNATICARDISGNASDVIEVYSSIRSNTVWVEGVRK